MLRNATPLNRRVRSCGFGVLRFTASFRHRLTPPILAKFVNGIKQGELTTEDGVKDGQFSLLDRLILFADGDGNERDLTYVNSIQIFDGKLSDTQVAALGGPLRIRGIILSGSNIVISWSGGPGIILQKKEGLSEPWQNIIGWEGTSNITLSVAAQGGFYRLFRQF